MPVGAIRFLVGTEALTGFVLVTWSASFTFVEMQRFGKTERVFLNAARRSSRDYRRSQLPAAFVKVRAVSGLDNRSWQQGRKVRAP